MVKLKLQYFGHLMQRTDSREKPWSWARLKAGGEGADRGWDGWVASLILWTYVWVSSRSWWWTRKPGMLQSMQTWLSNWTELNWWFFTVIIYGWESWTIKKAEDQRISTFKLWCWRRLLRVPWIERRSNQFKPVDPKWNQPWTFFGKADTAAEASVLWPPDVKIDLLEKTMIWGKTEGKMRRRWQRMRLIGWHQRFNGHEFEQISRDSEGQGTSCASVHGVIRSQTWFSYWTTTTKQIFFLPSLPF